MKSNPDIIAFTVLRAQNDLESAVAYLNQAKDHRQFFDSRQDFKAFRQELTSYYVDTTEPCENILQFYQGYKQYMAMHAPIIHEELLERIYLGASQNYSTKRLEEKTRRFEQAFHLQLGSPFKHGSQGYGYPTAGKLVDKLNLHKPTFAELDRALQEDNWDDVARLYITLRHVLS